jgi:GAF domain-containing protein
MFIVRKSARKLTAADGATFILKDKDQCFYADEDAISPLWKGQRFPSEACISGWVINNRQSAVIADIYKDKRIPVDAYRLTFVKSLAMMPIRTIEPIGAIGCYWKEEYTPSGSELKYLQALADVTAVAFEKLQIYNFLKQKVGSDIVDSHHTADILFSPTKFLAKLEAL